MKWWRGWRARHWDKRIIKDSPGQEVGQGWYEHVPKLREWCERAWADLVTHRWIALTIVGAIIAALLAKS